VTLYEDEDGETYVVCSICECEGNLFYSYEDSEMHLCSNCHDVNRAYTPLALRQRLDRAVQRNDIDTALFLNSIIVFLMRPHSDGR